MKNFLLLLILFLFATDINAAEIGDFYYGNQNFSAELRKGQKPVGLLFWISPNKDYGRVISEPSPADKSWQKAFEYCRSYEVWGKTEGQWHLPALAELQTSMIPEQNDEKIALLSKQLKIVSSEDLTKGLFWTMSEYGRKSVYAWAVDLKNNTVAKQPKVQRNRVLCLLPVRF